MRAEKISFRGFRNIGEESIEFAKGVNVLYGENAQGKTNALEGVYLFAHGKSFRTQNDRDMVSFDSSKASVELLYDDDDRKKELKFELFRTKRRVCEVNKAPAKLSEMIGLFRAVLFCPDHLSIIKDGPAVRRSFLNGAICQLKPVYLKSLQKYNRILEQRNSYIKKEADEGLKSSRAYTDIIDIYSSQLAKEAAYIYEIRKKYIEKLSFYVDIFFKEMSKGEKVTLVYKNSIRDKEKGDSDINGIYESYLDLFMKDRERERVLKTTLHGIHRDDIEIFIDSKEARLYASQGQQRSIALAMKLAEGEISREETGEYPVFLFDDVLSELDRSRQSFVLNKLDDRQVIITSCDISGFDSEMLRESSVIRVKNGSYEREND